MEFQPAVSLGLDNPVPVEIAELTRLAQEVSQKSSSLDVSPGGHDKENNEALLNIIRVGTSAGGARPKAVIAMDKNGHVLSGQTRTPAGYTHWIIKFDGVNDIELGEPKGYGRIEYSYYLMAKAAGITMTECRLLEEHGRAHLLTRRFDRQNGEKLHMLSLCGLAHYDFNRAGEYGRVVRKEENG